MKESVSLFHRFLSAIVGLLIGGILGMLALYFVMLLFGSDFGLDNVRPGAMFGGLGLFLRAVVSAAPLVLAGLRELESLCDSGSKATKWYCPLTSCLSASASTFK